ncbi:MAG TPA: PAS domain S-box protein [Mucilaginibacter sp.]|nr:PAS domain S-box protein [Mucilaginibacter sp.]
MENKGRDPKTNSYADRENTGDEKANNSIVSDFDPCSIAVIGINSAGIVTYINQSALSEFKFDKTPVTGASLFDLFTDVSAGRSCQESILKCEPVKDNELVLNVGGEKRWVLISSSLASENSAGINTYVFIRDITKYKKRESLYAYLNQAAAALAKVRDTATALRQIGQFIVPTFANWFTVDVLKNDGLELILLQHEDPSKVDWAYQYRKNYPPDLNGNAGAAVVFKSGKPGFVPVVTDEMIDMTVQDPVQRDEVRKIGLHSVIMAPMWTDGKVTGLVNFISSRPGRHFDEEDLNFAINFSNLISLSLANTRLNDEALNEIALRKQSEERFKFLLDAIPHKMWTSGPDGRATYYNKQWHDYTGVQGFENLREKIWSLIHPDDMAEAVEKWPKAIKTGEDMELEHRLKRFDGDYRWHLSRFSAYKDNNDQATLWVGTSTDIHDQKVYEMGLSAANQTIAATNEELTAANEELEAANEEQVATNEELIQAHDNLQNTIKDLEISRHRFKIFLDSIPQIAWASAATGDVEYYNQRWYDYTGMSFEETKNWGWKQVIHPDDLSHNLDNLAAIIQSRKPGEFEIREKGLDGIYRWHLVRMSPIFSPAGNLEQWIGTATDIDELKKLQQQKDDFISIASHELKTPLTSLRATIQLLYRMKDQPSIEKFQKLIEQANRSTHKMSVLVDELLNVHRIKERKLPLQKRWFILSELVNACCNHIAIAGHQQIVVLGDKTLQVYADEPAIDQVIVNLVNNAVKYAASSKEICIVIGRDRDKVKLSVKDTGPGISREQLPFLFDRYYQGGKQDYRNPGLGLGLYISSEIIKRHDGEIGVESQPGKGSTFWFTLPLTATTA